MQRHHFLPFMQQQEVLCGEERNKVALAREVVKIKVLTVDTSSVLMLKGDCATLFSSFHSNLPSEYYTAKTFNMKEIQQGDQCWELIFQTGIG